MLRINIGDRYYKFDIGKVESVKNALYVADLCIRRNGGWSDEPVAVFWQPCPRPGHSPYFGLFFANDNRLLITDASSVAEGVWHGMQTADGEIIFSRWRHDFRRSTDGTVSVDGGRDYVKISVTNDVGVKPVALRVVNGQFEVVETCETGSGDDGEVKSS